MKHRGILVISAGILAGVLCEALCWLLPTRQWLNALPWHRPEFTQPNETLLRATHVLLAGLACWAGYALRGGARFYSILTAAVVLCFTGGCAVSFHQISFDSFRTALCLVAGFFAGAWLVRGSVSRSLDLQEIFSGQLSDSAIESLAAKSNSLDLESESRPIVLLTTRVLNATAVQAKIGPKAYFELATNLQQTCSAFLMTRGAFYLTSSSAETIQAAFGVPLSSPQAPADAATTALLLKTALTEFLAEQKGGLLIGISLVQGTVASGVVNGRFAVFGPLLDTGRSMADENSRLNSFVLVDGQVALAIEDDFETMAREGAIELHGELAHSSAEATEDSEAPAADEAIPAEESAQATDRPSISPVLPISPEPRGKTSKRSKKRAATVLAKQKKLPEKRADAEPETQSPIFKASILATKTIKVTLREPDKNE